MPSVIRTSAVYALRAQEEIDHDRFDVDSVSHHVGGKCAVGENCAQQSGIAMINPPHGVEGVGCVADSSLDAGIGLREIGVGVTDADAHAAS